MTKTDIPFIITSIVSNPCDNCHFIQHELDTQESKWKYGFWSPGELVSLLTQCSQYLTALSGYPTSHQPNTDQVKDSRQVDATKYWKVSYKHLGSWLLQSLIIGWLSRCQLGQEWQTLPFRVLKSPGVGWPTPKSIRHLAITTLDFTAESA